VKIIFTYNLDASKKAGKIKGIFDNYLDFVHESYFVNDKDSTNSEKSTNSNTNNSLEEIFKEEENENTQNFKFSSLDLLLNPLRKKHVFELWNPFEIALFESCVCKFNKNFDLYPKIVKFFS
jgi:hypothetical protein